MRQLSNYHARTAIYSAVIESSQAIDNGCLISWAEQHPHDASPWGDMAAGRRLAYQVVYDYFKPSSDQFGAAVQVFTVSSNVREVVSREQY